MVTIKSKDSVASFSLEGAELKSLKIKGKEYIFQGDERFWTKSAPLLFPICSNLKDGEYILDGKTYQLGQHGYARFTYFEVESQSENSVTFIHSSNDQTRAQYPFEYDLRVSYTLTDKKLEVKYDVFNKDDKTMYFSIGSHEGYLFEDGVCDLDIVFPEKKTLYASVLEGRILSDNGKELIVDNSDTLSLNYSYFSVDAIIFENVDFDTILIRNRKTGQEIKVDFPEFPNLLIWSKPDAPYVCAELWCGITDRASTDKNLKTKVAIEKLVPGKNFVRTHSFEIVKEK